MVQRGGALFSRPESESDLGLVIGQFRKASHYLKERSDSAPVVVDSWAGSNAIQVGTEHDDTIRVAFSCFDKSIVDRLLFPLLAIL